MNRAKNEVVVAECEGNIYFCPVLLREPTKINRMTDSLAET